MADPMNRLFVLSFLFLGLPSIALAQRDPPLEECFLPSITFTHGKDSHLDLDLVFKKETGPVEHQQHQMYILACLAEDEAEILKIAGDVTLLDKREGKDASLFLDVLLEKRLVAKIATKVAPREGFAGRDVTGTYRDGSKVGRPHDKFLKLNTFTYDFSFAYADLFQSLTQLGHYQPEEIPEGTLGYMKARMKLFVFVPVNDCKYATDVDEKIRGENDFGMFDDRLSSDGEPLSLVTPILYFRPLPYELQFRKDEVVDLAVYVR